MYTCIHVYVIRKYEQRTTIKYNNLANKNVTNDCILYFYKFGVGANVIVL